MSQATVKTNYNRYRQNGGNWWTPYDGNKLFAGDTTGATSYEIVLRFNFSAYASYIWNSATLYLYRFNDEQAAHKEWTMAMSATAGGTLIDNSYFTFAFTAASAWKAIPLTAGQLAALKAGNQYIQLWGATGNYAGIRPLEYSSGAYAAYIILDYTMEPVLVPPTIPSIGTITTSNKAFDCGDSTDSSGIFLSTQLYYEMQLSVDGGATWRPTVYTSAQGSSQYVIPDLKAAGVLTGAGLQPQQYYFNASVRIRFRAKTPNWGSPAQPYYSAWMVSNVFAVNYKITPSAPAAPTPSKTDPYEGEAITFTTGRPAAYNSHDHTGATMILNYQMWLAPSNVLLVSSVEAVTSSGKVLNYTVGNLTSGMTDLVSNIRARTVDAENQIGAYTGNVPFTIRRFRAPAVAVKNYARTETTAIVRIRVLDTGYGGIQESAKIDRVQYNIGLGWFDAELDEWDELDNVFTITGLKRENSYNLAIRALNFAPPDTSLSGKTGVAVEIDVLEYIPGFFVWHKPSAVNPEAPAGGYMQSGIVGDDPDVSVNKGSFKVQNDLDVGGSLKKGGIDILARVYPVGSIYLSVVNTNPATFFGGTWVAWGTGRVPVGVDTGQAEFNTVEKTGGAKTHTLSGTEIPSHTHNRRWWDTAGGTLEEIPANRHYLNATAGWQSAAGDKHPVIMGANESAGGGGAHNNLQPYITCYMWKRTV